MLYGVICQDIVPAVLHLAALHINVQFPFLVPQTQFTVFLLQEVLRQGEARMGLELADQGESFKFKCKITCS